MRGLKALVVGMGVLIVAGLAVVVVTVAGRIADPPEPAVGAVEAPVAARVAIPPGARIVETATGDGRILLRLLLADGGTRILAIDLATGRLSGRVDLFEAPD